MNVRSFISCILSLLVLFSFFCIQSSAMTYPDVYPDYLPYKGVIYCEVQSSNLGKGTFIFPSSAQNNTFCRSYSGGIINISSSTITGIFIPVSANTVFNVRISFLTSPEYRDTAMSAQYHTINVTDVLNTNISFVDYSGSDTQNDKFFLSSYEKILLSLIVFDLFISGISLFIKVKRSLYD